ncbi:unnamed protein product, partial [Candidula unifasciata]
KWLERTPGLAVKSFHFWDLYKRSVQRWLQDMLLIPAQKETDEKVKETLLAEYKKQQESFESILDEEQYNSSVARDNHVMMVQRMIGSKVGTGGSSGYQYLRSTVSDRYKVFLDLFNMSTYLIPRHYIPPLSRSLKRQLSILIHETMPRDSDENDDDDDDDDNDTDEEEITTVVEDRLKDVNLNGDVDKKTAIFEF